MPEKNLTIRNCSANKIRIEPTEIKAEGGPEYPRLIIPVRLVLNPIKGWKEVEQNFVILSVQCSLFLQNHPFKIADAIIYFNPHKVSYPDDSITCSIEFHLDSYRIEKIEEKRIGDMKLMLDFHYLIALYEPLIIQNKEKQNKKDILTEFESPFVSLKLEIPQSHWVEKILPFLGYFQYFLVEIPKGKKLIQAAWENLEKAQSAFIRWDTKAVFAYCREIGVLLDKTIKDKFGKDSFSYSEKWNRAYKQFNHFASLDLHLENIKKSTKYSPMYVKVHKADAEHLLILTKSLIKYAGELLQEAE